MAITFKIDSDTIKSPLRQVWDSREPLDIAQNAAPLYPAKRKCTLEWSALTQAQWATIQANDDGVTHTVDIFPPNFSGDPLTQYSGVFVRVVNAGIEVGYVIMGASVEISNITA